MNKPLVVKFDSVHNWMTQILTEQLAWAKAKLPDASAERLKDYEAGLHTGMNQLLATLRVQGLIDVKIK